MKIKNLIFIEKVNVPDKRYIDLVDDYKTYPLGGGEWSIEAVSNDFNRGVIMEWVGLNGTQPGEECTDLWGEVYEWQEDPEGGLAIAEKGYSYNIYEAPDGTRGSYKYFMKEVRRGHLHGLLIEL